MLARTYLVLFTLSLMLVGCLSADTLYVRRGSASNISDIQCILVAGKYANEKISARLHEMGYYDPALATLFFNTARETFGAYGIATSVSSVPYLTPSAVTSKYYLVIKPAKASVHSQMGHVYDMYFSTTLFEQATGEPDHVLWIGSLRVPRFDDKFTRRFQTEILVALGEQGILANTTVRPNSPSQQAVSR